MDVFLITIMGMRKVMMMAVITKGESMLRFKRKMEELGANVIAGFSVGRTKHERPNDFEI